jgi:hypothetical protein
MTEPIRPIPGDPGAATIVSMMDLGNQEWWVTAVGDYRTAAVEAMKHDGSDFQRVVAVEWPAKLNNGDTKKVIRLLLAPEDAIGLAESLIHTAAWLLGSGE